MGNKARPSLCNRATLQTKCRPEKKYLKAVKRVVRYLKRMMHMGIIYGQISNNPPLYGLTGYDNSKFAGKSID